jgi:2'-5' RNA ligase
MRAFLGIDFDKEVKNNILVLQQRLRKYTVKGRWKYIDNFHLTLKFLGEVNGVQHSRIDKAINRVCTGMSPFSLIVEEFGVFKGRESVRVLWIGLSGEVGRLKSLQKAVDNATAPLGFLPEKRRYTPHVTIGQDIVFECPFEQIREAIGEARPGIVNVNSLYLFKSEQIQGKRIYSKVSEYKFHSSNPQFRM